jgi:hypothetical protein
MNLLPPSSGYHEIWNQRLGSNYYIIVRFEVSTAATGMLRRVALVRTDVSEDLSASFIRVTRIR